jgi:hypothetical protein
MSVVVTRPTETRRPGLADLRVAVCRAAREVAVARCGPHLRALVLTGSLARDEATVRRGPTGATLLGDVDFLMVVHDGARLPSPRTVRSIAAEIESRLAGQALRCHVTLSAVRPRYLAALPAHIFSYELKACGVPVAGDLAILSLIPSFTGAEIEPEDAWRLLANRIVEHLEDLPVFVTDPEGPGEEAGYRLIKLCLDMATSFLVFAGRYVPTYEGRAESLRRLAAAPGVVDGPFPLGPFAELVTTCTGWKLSGTLPEPAVLRTAWEPAIAWAEWLWRWELARLTGLDQSIPPDRLLERWMARQSLTNRLRGWAFVLRRQGWHRGWRHWPRWIRLARRTSPRYGVYAAAAGLLFSRCYLPGRADAGAVDEAARWLPIVPRPAIQGGAAWRRLVGQIARHYREFLVETRA